MLNYLSLHEDNWAVLCTKLLILSQWDFVEYSNCLKVDIQFYLLLSFKANIHKCIICRTSPPHFSPYTTLQSDKCSYINTVYHSLSSGHAAFMSEIVWFWWQSLFYVSEILLFLYSVLIFSIFYSFTFCDLWHLNVYIADSCIWCISATL